MWVQKLRLKNIKSYGEGDSGQGVTVVLEQGINQITGKNGAGKSTLIEAIGYALFDAEPVRGNSRIAKNTYLLRNGSKAGEIDVWLWYQDCLYRVERDVGNGGRRWKVVREDDDFIEAEGEQEVKSFLAGVAGVAGPERLAEVYHSLLGVKQGRFTLPFDLKPSEAKNHFDPLLDVDIFRQCFDYLKEPCDEIRQEIYQQQNILSGLAGQMAQLQDAPARLEEAHKQRATQELLVTQCQEQRSKAASEVERYDALMNSHQTGLLKAREVRGQVAQAQTEVQTLTARVEEANHAQQVLVATQADYLAYTNLEKEISQLEKQRTQRDQLTKALTLQQKEETGLIRDQAALQQEATRDRTKAAEKETEYQPRWQKILEEQEQFRAGEAKASADQQQAEKLRQDLARVVEWLKGMSAINKPAIEQLKELQESLAQLDPTLTERVALVRHNLAQAEADERSCQTLLERTKQDHRTLQQQLSRLSDGQCPLLGTACGQFDPAKAQQDVEQLQEKLQAITAEHQNRIQQLSEAKAQLEQNLTAEKNQVAKLAKVKQLAKSIQSLYQQLEDAAGRMAAQSLAQTWPLGQELPYLGEWQGGTEPDAAIFGAAVEAMKALQMAVYQGYQRWEPLVKEHYQAATNLVTQRAARQKELDGEAKALQTLKRDCKLLLESASEAEQRASVVATQLGQVKEQIQVLELKLQPFAGVDEKLAQANGNKTQHLPGYTQYLQNQPIAQKLTEFRQRVEQAQKHLQELEEQQKLAEEALQAAEAAYSPDQHKAVKDTLALANLALGEATSKLAEAQNILKEQQQRMELLDQLQRQREQQQRELLRLQMEEKLLEKARQVLKNAQEPVARNLTNRVAAQAQAIYNTMSSEAAQFQWRASDYSLSMTTVSGEKRFASLSGGQQMKAALAMQLALVKEFSTAGFCAFDEPTYGLDAESRTMLAEAISKAQEECKFTQLLLVSHDQAFDDKVEYALNLSYSPVAGTVPEE